MSNNLIAIAERYGGFKYGEDKNEISMLAIIEKVNLHENKAHRLAEVLCDGEPHGFAFLSDLAFSINPSVSVFYKNKNIEKAEEQLDWHDTSFRNELAGLFVNEEKFKNEFFINRDPRGYALKLNFGDERVAGVYTDWGGYGIIAPEDFC